MKYLLPLILVIVVNSSWGQSKQLDVQSDTSFWFALKQDDARRIGLIDLTISSDSLHFRYWMENQAIDIWTKDFITFYGFISNHTESVENNSRSNYTPKPGKYYCNKTNLTSSEAKNVYQLFGQANMFKIPTDKFVNGWGRGFDGAEYLFEYSTKDTYSFKAYWTPSAQSGVPEADAVNSLNQNLRSILKLKSNWDAFLASLPPGCYRAGEMTIICMEVLNKTK